MAEYICNITDGNIDEDMKILKEKKGSGPTKGNKKRIENIENSNSELIFAENDLYNWLVMSAYPPAYNKQAKQNNKTKKNFKK